MKCQVIEKRIAAPGWSVKVYVDGESSYVEVIDHGSPRFRIPALYIPQVSACLLEAEEILGSAL